MECRPADLGLDRMNPAAGQNGVEEGTGLSLRVVNVGELRRGLAALIEIGEDISVEMIGEEA